MTTITVRAGTPADVPELRAMIAEFQAYIIDIHPTDPPVVPTEADLLRDGFGPGRFFDVLIAEVAGRAAGYVTCHAGHFADGACGALVITDLYVRAAHRRAGVGAAMMRHAAEVMRARGARVILWTVWERNPRAIAFYTALGAKRIGGEIPMAWWPDGETPDGDIAE